jgi:putative membrane protein
MRELLKRVSTNALSLFLVSLLFSGLSISGGVANYLTAGLLLAVFSTVLDPIVRIITLPFNILTLGLLSFLTTLAALFVLTLFYSNVSVNAFTFSGISFLGLSIGKIAFSRVLSFVVISATIYLSNRFLTFLFESRR